MSAVVGAALHWHKVLSQLTSILNQNKQKFVATYRLKIEPKTLMSNLVNSSSISTSKSKFFSTLCMTMHLEKVSFVLADDCVEAKNQLDEYFRITADTFLVTLRPRILNLQPFQSLGGQPPVHMDACFSVGNIQVDNQVYRSGKYDFPVVLKGHEDYQVPKIRSSLSDSDRDGQSDRILKSYKENSILRLDMDFEVAFNSMDLLSLRSIAIRTKPLDVFIEDIFLYKVAEVLKSFTVSIGTEDLMPKSTTVLKEVLLASNNLSQNLCLDRLDIAPMTVLVSVHASIKAYVGLDQSPLQFGGYHRRFLRTTHFALGQSIAKHYISGTLFRAGWVVGSLELIGSPAGLTRAVGDGLRDFISLPYHGFLNGPWGFLTGVTHGSSSLVKHVSAGTLTSVTNFASSVSRNLDRLSLDNEHCQRNEVARRALPIGVSHGLANGLSGIGISILGAIGGLAHHPIKALVENGATPSGLVGGITRGLVGVVTKPLGGAAEFVAQTGHGLLVGTGWTEKLRQREPSLPQHVCSVASSGMKFGWKLNCGQIVMIAEATKAEDLSPVTLVLTTEAILIIAEDEDCAETVLSLSEMTFVETFDEDPTRMELVWLTESSNHFASRSEQDDITNERIVQFVMESGHGLSLSDRPDRLATVDTSATVKSRQRRLAFLANPVVKQAFVDYFQIASSNIRQFGFPIFT